MIGNDQSKEIARRLIFYFQFYWPKVVALRDAVRAMNEMLTVFASTWDVLDRADKAYCTDPDKEEFFTLEQELATRAALLMRRGREEGKIENEADAEKVDAVAFEQARADMRARGKEVPSPPQDRPRAPDAPNLPGLDHSPMAFLALKALFSFLPAIIDKMVRDDALELGRPAPLTLLKFQLAAGFTPYPTENRPSMEFAQFLAWLIQDTGPREMTDTRVAAFLETEFEKLPPEVQRYKPSAKTIANWRRDREQIAGICPRRDETKKPK